MPLTHLPSSTRNESKAELQLILNAIVEGLCGLDSDGNVTFCNEAFQKMTGYGHEEIIGRDLYHLLHSGRPVGEKQSCQNSPFRKTPDSQPSHSAGEVYWRKDGTCIPAEYWFHALQRPLRLTVSVATIHDISERKHAEEKLLFEAALLEAQSETTLDGILVVDGAGKIARTNKQFRLMFAVPGEFLAGSDDSILLRHVLKRVENPDDFEAKVEHLYRHPQEESRDEINLRDGRLFDRYSAPLIDSNGRHRGRIWYFRDITERKAAENERRLMQFSLENAADDVHWVNPQGRIVYANEAACRSLGWTREELLSLSIVDLDPLITKESWLAVWEEIKRRGSITFEARHQTKEGRIFPVEVSAKYLAFDGQEYDFAFVRDITERKQTEEALRASEKRYRLLFERNLAGIFRTTLAGQILDCNPAAARMFGYESLAEMRSLRAANLYYQSSDRDALLEELKSGKSVTNREIRFRRKDGDSTWVIANLSLVEEDTTMGGVVEGMLMDITERKLAGQQIQESRELLQIVLDSVPEAVYGIDLQGKCTFCNPACLRLLGYQEPADLLGRNMHSVMHHTRADGTPYPVDECHIYEAFRMGKGTHVDDEVIWHRNGSSFPAEYWSHPMHRGEEVIGTVVAFVNITERLRTQNALQASEKRYRFLFERNLAGIFRTTLEGKVLDCNQAAARIFGCESPQELLALPINDYYHSASDYQALMTRLKSEKRLTNHEMRFRRKNGDSAWTMLNLNLVDDDSGAARIVEGTFVDITERKVAQDLAQSLAYFDALTGLPNRTLLRDRLTQALAAARRQNYKVGILFLDLDRFKIINDSLGHSVGDLLLQEVAERLKHCAREQDTVARLGGDEFLIVLTTVKDLQDVAIAAERFMDAMSAGFVIQGHALTVGCSLGVSIFPEHGADSETLIKNADAALYSAKDSGRNNFQVFTPHMNAQAVERLTLENGLRLALDHRELFLLYQPQMEMASGRITGLEALLRWRHPKLGLVPAPEFIRIAENSGLIIPIGEWVLRTACAQARKWQDEGLPPVSIAVNVSAVQFRQEGFPKTIFDVLRDTGLAPQFLELELTESLLLSNADLVFSVLQQLTVMGVRLAIDDFGTGYSSLSYLKRFPVSKLKIDRSFIRDVAENSDDAAITTAIISMAKSLSLKVIAEGVENEAQMSFLRAHQCDEIQGYYFSIPLAVEEVADKLRAAASEARVHAQASGKQS